MRRINLLAALYLIFIFFFIQSALAINASSTSYSIGMFGNGLQTSGSVSGSYSFRFVTLESPGTRNAVTGSYLTNVGFFGNTGYYESVRINSYSISPKSAVIGSTIGLYVSALNAESVWAEIISPNNQEQTLILINGDLVNYLPSPSVVGRYNVTFYANSSDGSVATILDYFDLVEQPEEPEQPGSPKTGGGGGGGTTIIERNCTYIWDCTPWSVCSNGKQTRQCTNVGNCIGSENRPSEKINCTESLFDISLDTSDIKIINNTLAFKIDLIEKMSNQKIDVHIKYSIIDSTNNEIFSQIETKAIDGTLLYEKELRELNLENGDYILRVDILYGNLQRAFSEQKFSIREQTEILDSDKTMTGRVVDLFYNDEGPSYRSLIWILLVLLLFIARHKMYHALKAVISLFLKFRVHSRHLGIKGSPHNSIMGLMGKKVYSESGDYIGKIEDIILGKGKIDSLKIKLSRRTHFKGKGILIGYNAVWSVKDVLIAHSGIIDKFEKG